MLVDGNTLSQLRLRRKADSEHLVLAELDFEVDRQFRVHPLEVIDQPLEPGKNKVRSINNVIIIQRGRSQKLRGN